MRWRPRGWTGVDALVALAIAGLMLGWLDRPDLMEPDEGRHAEIAREMLATGHFITPKLHGQPYYHKPPFFHWTVAASISLFGANAGAARLPSALSALWLVAVLAWWASKAWSPAVGRLTAGLVATTLAVVATARYVLIDMMFTAALVSALVWLGVWFLEWGDAPNPPRRSIYPFYALVGLATLIKGPVAIVLAGLVALASTLVFFGPSGIKKLRPFSGGIVALALALPWYLAAWFEDPAYIQAFLLRHNLGRYAVAGSVGHQQPWYYYLVAGPLVLLPWVFYLPWALDQAWARSQRGRAEVYCFLWAITVTAFFMPAKAKLVTYLLPALPPLLCLLAVALERTLVGSGALPPLARRLQLGWSMLIGLLCSAAGGYALFVNPEEPARALLLVAALVTLATGLRAWRSGEAERALLCGALSTAALVVTVWGLGAGLISSVRSLRPAATIVASSDPPVQRLLSYRASGHTLAFYAGRVLERLDSRETIVPLLAFPPGVALLSKQKYLAELGLEPLPEGWRLAWRGALGKVLLVGTDR
ncbi:MAG: ArnT family glycosyltransferase [Candidatus Binatia bacterium]